MSILAGAVPSSRDLQALFQSPELSVPDLAAMQADIDRIIESVARRYTDLTCYALRFDDLVAEGNAKLALILTQGILTRVKSREEFFRYFKTTINNHIKSLVQRHRGTQKRMGGCLENGGKPEVSLDAEDDDTAPLQIGVVDGRTSELVESMRVWLNPLERLVFDQMLEPNDDAMVLATIDAYRDHRPRTELDVKVQTTHMAKGLGLELAAFLEVQKAVKSKLKKHMSEHDEEDTKFNSAVAVLENTFSLQVPPYTEPIVIKRLFTLAARDQSEKMSDPVRRAMVAVGAKVPEALSGGTLACYGVLFQRNHRVCSQCALCRACEAEAANYGLGEIVLSPRLLGSRLTRVPTLTVETDAARITVSDGPVVESSRDEQVIAFLDDTLKRASVHGEIYFRHRAGKPKYIFWLGQVPGRQGVSIRFCKPSDRMRVKLDADKRCSYLPSSVGFNEAKELINQHIEETYRDRG